jgi:hypothetical protein
MSSMLNPVCKYIARLMCLEDGVHTHRKPLVCSKHAAPIYKCKHCKTKWISYTYRCGICGNSFCIYHYLYHVQLFRQQPIRELCFLCSSNYLPVPQKSELQTYTKKFKKIALNLRSTKLKINFWKRCSQKENILAQIMDSESINTLGTAFYKTLEKVVLEGA